MNNVILSGRLTRDPELAFTRQNSIQNVRFTLAVDKNLTSEKKSQFEQEGKPTADFISVVVWGRLAESVARYTGKGSRVIVFGRVQTGSYKNKDGDLIYTTDIVASNIEFIDWKEPDDVFQPFPDYEPQY